ncbi:MAG: EboA domain-containing protein [Pseudomonadota bacterium]
MPVKTVEKQLAGWVSDAGDANADWLTKACRKQQEVAAEDLADTVSLHWAMARRRLGTDPLAASHPDKQLTVDGVDAGRWSVGDAGRIVLLLHAMALNPAGAPALAASVYRAGDESERAAMVRALALFDEPEDYRDIALETGRANSLVLYGALAEFNPYPALVYTEHDFNQLVLKTIFTGLSIARIVGLQRRINADLARMCEDFHDERKAAGRTVPVDMWLAMAPHGSPRAVELVTARLSDDDPAHRLFAATALGWSQPADAPAVAALREALATEQDERVRAAMQASLDHIDNSSRKGT